MGSYFNRPPQESLIRRILFLAVSMHFHQFQTGFHHFHLDFRPPQEQFRVQHMQKEDREQENKRKAGRRAEWKNPARAPRALRAPLLLNRVPEYSPIFTHSQRIRLVRMEIDVARTPNLSEQSPWVLPRTFHSYYLCAGPPWYTEKKYRNFRPATDRLPRL